MKKTIVCLALLLAFLPAAALASSWAGDPGQIDEEPIDIVIEEAPEDIYEDRSPATGDASMLSLLASAGASSLAAAGIALKRKAAKA